MDPQTLDQIAEIEAAFDEVLLPGPSPIRASVVLSYIMYWPGLTVDRVHAVMQAMPEARVDEHGFEALRIMGRDDILRFLEIAPLQWPGKNNTSSTSWAAP
jgi:hypothetical protein